MTPIGTGCRGVWGPPDLRPVAGSLPWVGEVFQMRCSTVPPFPLRAFASLGLSPTHWNGLPLPLSLAGYGMPGCTLYGSIDVVLPLTRSAASSSIFWDLPIPNDPALLRLHVYVQVWPYELTSVIVSNALDLEIGGR